MFTKDNSDLLPASKALQNALYRKSSCFTVEIQGTKPDCKGVKISLSRKWIYKCLKTIRSRTLFMLLKKNSLRQLLYHHPLE